MCLLNEVASVTIYNQHCQNWQGSMSGGLPFFSIFILPRSESFVCQLWGFGGLPKEMLALFFASYFFFPTLPLQGSQTLVAFDYVFTPKSQLSSRLRKTLYYDVMVLYHFAKGQRDLECLLTQPSWPLPSRDWFLESLGCWVWRKGLWEWTLTEHHSVLHTMLNSWLLTWSLPEPTK